MIRLTELLQTRGFTPNDIKQTKIARHKSNQYDIHKLFINDQLETYQSVQRNPVFHKCRYVASFIGLEGTTSMFVGLYEVKGFKVDTNEEFQWPTHYLYPEMNHGQNVYDLVKDERFKDLEGRVIIDWGKGAINWHQWLQSGEKDKEVLEVLKSGYVTPFPGYLDFVLNYTELQKIINNEASNSEWHIRLGSVSGIYLITDSLTGGQYVGSAYGSEGILGRWKNYAVNGHGGNKILKELVESTSGYQLNFHFTILRTLPKTLTSKEVIEFENLYKEKLGSRVFGLNAN